MRSMLRARRPLVEGEVLAVRDGEVLSSRMPSAL